MTFYFLEDENVLEGNHLGRYTEIDGDEVRIDVDAIMEEGRGIQKLDEMRMRIEDAIDANAEGGE